MEYVPDTRWLTLFRLSVADRMQREDRADPSKPDNVDTLGRLSKTLEERYRGRKDVPVAKDLLKYLDEAPNLWVLPLPLSKIGDHELAIKNEETYVFRSNKIVTYFII